MTFRFLSDYIQVLHPITSIQQAKRCNKNTDPVVDVSKRDGLTESAAAIISWSAMEAPKMQEMSMEDTAAPYLGLFADPHSTSGAPTKKYLLLENQRRLMTYHWASRLSFRRGLIVLVHGFGEHLGRYFHVANFFAEQGQQRCGGGP